MWSGDDIHARTARAQVGRGRRYEPTSAAGQALIGHELAHIVQQRQGRVTPTRETRGVAINDDASLEHEADALGHQAARGEPTGASTASTAAQCSVVQRVSIIDHDADEAEIWDEVAYYLFEDREIASEHHKALEALFDKLPEDEAYEFYEDIADELEHQLCLDQLSQRRARRWKACSRRTIWTKPLHGEAVRSGHVVHGVRSPPRRP